MLLDVDGAGTSDGNKILMWHASGGASQQWNFVEQADGSFGILNAHSGKALDVYNAYKSNGALVEQWTWWGGANQRWRLQKIDNANYQIVNVNSGLCLDAWMNWNTNGAGLQQWDCHGSGNQLWQAVHTPRGAGCALATAGGNTLVNKVAVPQLGWMPKARKVALQVTTQQVAPPTFSLWQGGTQILQGQAQAGSSRWGLWTNSIDLSRVAQEGVYTLKVAGMPDSCVEVSQKTYGEPRQGNAGATSIAALLGSFFATQRCGTPADILINPDDKDVGLPLFLITSGGNLTRLAGQSGDVSGGWHDATSTDKELASIGRALEAFTYAYSTTTDAIDRVALLDEMTWGVNYLLKTQNQDGSWYLSVRPFEPWHPSDSPPRRLEINVDTGSTSRAGSALAAFAQATQTSAPALSAQAQASAERAYAWMLANPNHFVGDDVVQASHHGNATCVLDFAVNMAMLEPTAAHKQYVHDLILSGNINAGLWSANNGRFFGQQGWYGVEDSQAVVPLLRYWAVAPADVQAAISQQARNWLSFLQTQQDATWGMDQEMIVSWYGGNGTLVDNTLGMLLIYRTLGWPEALSFAQNNLDWIWGRNPFGTSFVPGLGRDVGVAPFGRTLAQSGGAVLPGPLSTSNGSALTLATDAPWDEWQVGEATIDSSSGLLWALTMLQQIYQ